MSVKRPRILACRYCGDECDASNRDTLSHWTHNHPSVCPYRTDSVPSLNGVHVGDVWRNLHTKRTVTIEAIRLGGCGTYTDREPVVVLVDDESPSEWRYVSPHPLWGLSEHWEPISRPGVYPVPWTRSRRFRGRSALLVWRGGGIRGQRSKRKEAYWSSYHTISGNYISGWSTFWQVDPRTEATARMALQLIESGDETLARVGERVAAMLAEAA